MYVSKENDNGMLRLDRSQCEVSTLQMQLYAIKLTPKHNLNGIGCAW